MIIIIITPNHNNNNNHKNSKNDNNYDDYDYDDDDDDDGGRCTLRPVSSLLHVCLRDAYAFPPQRLICNVR